jgi:hypothetical protein
MQDNTYPEKGGFVPLAGMCKHNPKPISGWDFILGNSLVYIEI